MTIEAEGEYVAMPRMRKVTVLGAGQRDEVKEIEVDIDLSKGGEIKW
jgi:hypothetical protein